MALLIRHTWVVFNHLKFTVWWVLANQAPSCPISLQHCILFLIHSEFTVLCDFDPLYFAFLWYWLRRRFSLGREEPHFSINKIVFSCNTLYRSTPVVIEVAIEPNNCNRILQIELSQKNWRTRKRTLWILVFKLSRKKTSMVIIDG